LSDDFDCFLDRDRASWRLASLILPSSAVDHEVIAAFTTSLETFPVDLDVLVELFNVAFNRRHVSIEAREVLTEETGSRTGIDDCFLHEKLEEKCSACTAVCAFTNMILILFGEDLDAPFFVVISATVSRPYSVMMFR